MRVSTIILGLVVLASGCVGGQQQSRIEIGSLDSQIGEFSKNFSVDGETSIGTAKQAVFQSNSSKVRVKALVTSNEQENSLDRISISEKYPNATSFSVKGSKAYMHEYTPPATGNQSANSSVQWKCMWRSGNLIVSAEGMPGDINPSRGDVKRVCSAAVQSLAS